MHTVLVNVSPPQTDVTPHMEMKVAPLPEVQEPLHRRYRCQKVINSVLYSILALCVATNIFVLFNEYNTIFYLRLYHIVASSLMLLSSGAMVLFMKLAAPLPKLPHAHSIPRPTLIGAIALTIGIAVGYAYFLIFNYVFNDCDKLVDVEEEAKDQLWLDVFTSFVMIFFSCISLFYILQRSYYGALDSAVDSIIRKWINIVFLIVWIKIVIYKGYLSNKELCQRRELEGHWCPVRHKTYYTCDPDSAFKGMKKIWYYLHKGLLNSAIISCASEFFPVMLVAHWLVCGGAEHKADDWIKRKQKQRSVRTLLHSFVTDITNTYGAEKPSYLHDLQISNLTSLTMTLLAWVASIVTMVRWFMNFYYTMNFDKLYNNWMPNEYAGITASAAQLILFTITYKLYVKLERNRFDVHHKAESRGDIVLMLGSCVFLAIKFVLQVIELQFQWTDHKIPTAICWLRVGSLVMMHCSEWVQYFLLRRVLALSDNDVRSMRSFLPSVAFAGTILNWVYFGLTFFETSSMKYQLSLNDYTSYYKFGYSRGALVCNIFTQVIYPADYLYAFTAAGCWMDVLVRYLNMGYFQIGNTSLDCHTSTEENVHAGPLASKANGSYGNHLHV